MPHPKVELTDLQRKKLEKLWFIYGNNGPKSTMTRHKYIQGFLEHGYDFFKFYEPDKEVFEQVWTILLEEE